MICSSCLRDVPDLIGPGWDLCVECYGVAPEDYMPSVLLREAESWEVDPWLEEAGSGDELFAEAEALIRQALEEGGSPFDPPCFRGRPRF